MTHKMLCAALLVGSAVSVQAVEKTWELTLPSDPVAFTNKAPVKLSDGNYKLRGWIVSTNTLRIGIGVADCTDAGGFTVGQAICKDENGNLIGSGDLDMRGTLTTNGVASGWTISTIGRYSFLSYRVAPFEVCTLPTTLLSMDNNTFQMCGATSGFSTFILEAPNMTGDLPNNTFLSVRNPTRMTLKIPKVTCIGGYWARSSLIDFLSETDVSDWDLSSVQMVATGGWQTKNDVGWLFRYSKMRGTMRLPSMKWLNPCTFEHCPNLNALEIGKKGTLEYVGRYAARACDSLGSVVLGGVAGGFTISSNAFYSANISNVTFLTTAPTFEESETVVFGTEATPARSIAFHIPRRDTRFWELNWRRYALAARAPTEAERTAFVQRFGSYAATGLVGIIPASLFHTAAEQWLVCGFSPALRHRVTAHPLDPRFTGDGVTVSPAPDADGCYAAGTEVTLTATYDAATAVFGKWRGTVDPEKERQNPITLTVDRDLDLQANVRHDWTFRFNDPEETSFAWGKNGTVSNEVWTLNVMVSGPGTFYYGQNGNVASGAFTARGGGTLDLNGRVLWERDPTVSLTMNGYAGQAFHVGNGNALSLTVAPRMIITPEDCGVNPAQVFRNWVGGNVSVTNFIMEDVTLTGNGFTDGQCGHNWKSALLRLPKMTMLMSNYNSTFVSEAGTDVSAWRLDSMTDAYGERVGQWGVSRGILANQAYHGTLHLPSLATVQTNAFRGAYNLEAAEIGTNTVVTSIGTKAFNGCSSLVRLRLRSGKDLTVGADAFTGTAKLRYLEFTYQAPRDPTAVDNILAGTTASVAEATEPTIIYGSRLLGWNRAQCASITAPTAAELAARPLHVPSDGTLVGVWETAAGARKAWVVHVPSPDDPKGSILIFR